MNGLRRILNEKSHGAGHRDYEVTDWECLVEKQALLWSHWLQVEDCDSVIPQDGWFKLPGSGHIRIKRTAVLLLQGEQ